MKGLFQAQDKKGEMKRPDVMRAAAAEEKPGKKKHLSSGSDNLNAFLGEGTAFKGILTFEGSVRIDGRLEGEIFTKDTLVVGKGAEVKADIHAGAISVTGEVRGNITVERKVELHAGARLFGDISTPSLIMAEGVIFEGSCTMGKKTNRQEPKKDKAEAAPQREVVGK
jgi:cytoskeletal protein CcmA (bactofilin family)